MLIRSCDVGDHVTWNMNCFRAILWLQYELFYGVNIILTLDEILLDWVLYLMNCGFYRIHDFGGKVFVVVRCSQWMIRSMNAVEPWQLVTCGDGNFSANLYGGGNDIKCLYVVTRIHKDVRRSFICIYLQNCFTRTLFSQNKYSWFFSTIYMLYIVIFRGRWIGVALR